MSYDVWADYIDYLLTMRHRIDRYSRFTRFDISARVIYALLIDAFRLSYAFTPAFW